MRGHCRTLCVTSDSQPSEGGPSVGLVFRHQYRRIAASLNDGDAFRLFACNYFGGSAAISRHCKAKARAGTAKQGAAKLPCSSHATPLSCSYCCGKLRHCISCRLTYHHGGPLLTLPACRCVPTDEPPDASFSSTACGLVCRFVASREPDAVRRRLRRHCTAAAATPSTSLHRAIPARLRRGARPA